MSAGRKRVLDSKGGKKLRVWIEEKIKDPTFDNPLSVMPYLSVSDEQARGVTNFLLRERKPKQEKALLK